MTPDDELGGDAELTQLAPSPERMVLAVAPAELFESGRMLPIVSVSEQLQVRCLFASGEPVAYVSNGLDADRGLPIEVVPEVVTRAEEVWANLDLTEGPDVLVVHPLGE